MTVVSRGRQAAGDGRKGRGGKEEEVWELDYLFSWVAEGGVGRRGGARWRGVVCVCV